MACFMKKNGTVENISTDATACGNPSSEGISSCCYNGDTCMSDGFCQYTHLEVGGSGYYRAGCTDSTYNSPDCPPECSDEASPDAVYDFTTGAWTCCGGSPASGFSCNEPTGPSFTSPAPAQLTALRDGSSAGTTAGTPSSIPTSSHNDQKKGSHWSGSHSRGGLSSQTIIGISVGASIAAVTLVILSAILFYRLRQRRKAQPFRRGSEPVLLPASVRNSNQGPDAIRAPSATTISHPSISSMSEAHLRPLPLRQATNVSDLSYPPPSTRGSQAHSISTWSSFSTGDRRASHLEINLPEQQNICEMRGERTPQELQGTAPGTGTKSPLSAKELQARELHMSLRAHPTARSGSGQSVMSPGMGMGMNMNMNMAPALALAPGGSGSGSGSGMSQGQGQAF